MSCPCGNTKSFSQCCAPYIEGAKAPTAEALMRSRYSAFAKGQVDYIKKTTAPEALQDFDEEATGKWSTQSKWLGLKVLSTEKGGIDDLKGKVEFVARYSLNGQETEHHEVSEFRREPKDQRWYFVEGHHPGGEPVKREEPKVGRNDPCPCGSGKKYKRCHGGDSDN